MKTLGYLGIDQCGNSYRIEKSPRKELMEQLGATGAKKMYVDLKGGRHRHVGYVIGELWIRVYRVCPWKEAGWN